MERNTESWVELADEPQKAVKEFISNAIMVGSQLTTLHQQPYDESTGLEVFT